MTENEGRMNERFMAAEERLVKSGAQRTLEARPDRTGVGLDSSLFKKIGNGIV